MKRKVTITFEIDASEYHGCKDHPASVNMLVDDILHNGADWPTGDIIIECEGQVRLFHPSDKLR